MVNIVTGFGETAGAALAAHPDVDKVAFTGSTEVGQADRQAAAGNLKKVSLELGGKSPAIVFCRTPISTAAIAGAASAIFFNHGQCCCAGSRLYAHKVVFDQVVEGVADSAGKIKARAGPRSRHRDGAAGVRGAVRARHRLSRGRPSAEGAKVVAGGGTRSAIAATSSQPTVLTNTKPDMKVIREEIFGPVVCAIAVRRRRPRAHRQRGQ